MVFVFDIDGTICFDGHTIPSEIYNALLQLDKVAEIVFASARSYRDCIPVLKNFKNHTVIGLNGAQIYQKGTCVYNASINDEAYAYIYSFCHSHKIPFFVDDVFNYYAFLEQEIPFFDRVNQLQLASMVELHEIQSPTKIVVMFKSNAHLLQQFISALSVLNVEVMFHEQEEILYINPLNCNKATSILQLFKNYICFGNDKNDIEMFQNAIYSVQVGNYQPLNTYAKHQIDAIEVAPMIVQLKKQIQN